MGTVADFRAAASVLMDRFRFFKQAGITFGGKRDTYEILGYQRRLSFEDFRDRYQRGGIATRIVEAYPKATWRGGIELFEDEDPNKLTPFEQAWKDIELKFGIWQKLQAVDILAGLSTYAVMLIGAPGASLTEPLPKGKPGQLLYFQPFSGGGGPVGDNRTLSQAMNADCTIESFDTDAQSPRFGEPLYYQLRRTILSAPMLAQKVHWTRILHVAEGCLEDNVYGVPTLENVWNLLDDLDKVTGGGAEAFWMRANAGLHLNVDKTMQLAATPSGATATSPATTTSAELDKLRQDAEDYAHQITRMIRTRGVEINQLGSDVANFGPPAEAILKQIAGSKGIPQRILTGSEMGSLASEQDATNFDNQVQDRRTGYAEPCMVRRLVDRLVEYGYLPPPKEYKVGWPVEEDMDEAGKADYAAKLATVNQTYGSVVFTDDEIRDMAFNKEPLTPEQKEAATPEPPPAPAVIVDPNAKPEEEETVKEQAARLKAARALEDAELLRVLEAAIEADNEEVISAIVGVTHRALGDVEGHEFHGNQYTSGGGPVSREQDAKYKELPHGTVVARGRKGTVDVRHEGDRRKFGAVTKSGQYIGGFSTVQNAKEALEHPRDFLEARTVQRPSFPVDETKWKHRTLEERKLASTQIDLHLGVAEKLLALGRAIPDEDLAEKGREAEPHVTVKYGLIDPDVSKLQAALAVHLPATLTLGRTWFFATPDYDVVYVSVVGGNLDVLNKAVTNGVKCAPTEHDYVPHATVAYVKPGRGEAYARRFDLDGVRVDSGTVTLVDVDGTRMEVGIA